MGGLLYKDYILIDRIGRIRLSWILGIVTVLFVILRVLFPGTGKVAEQFLAYSEDGVINLIDLCFFIFLAIFQCFFILFFEALVDKITDEENNIKKMYISSLPIKKNTFIASKYVFLLIVAYIMLSASVILGVSGIAFCKEGLISRSMNLLNSFHVSIVSFLIFISGMELPLYFLIGKEKARVVKGGILIVLVWALCGYFLFGNLEWLNDEFYINTLMAWLNKHETEFTILQSLSVPVVGLFYYVSYRFTSYVYEKKES
ncbi:MAG: ABC-2 transporter permease [Lachnospiraceae bacterium]|nr:ABC-2 transporter permease [Lachnospiraceae bacterium]